MASLVPLPNENWRTPTMPSISSRSLPSLRSWHVKLEKAQDYPKIAGNQTGNPKNDVRKNPSVVDCFPIPRARKARYLREISDISNTPTNNNGIAWKGSNASDISETEV